MAETDQCAARDHNVEASLFCREDSCKMALCVHCFLGNHRNHSIVGIDEEKKRVMAEMNEMIEKRSWELKKKKSSFWTEKYGVLSQNKQCRVTNLKRQLLAQQGYVEATSSNEPPVKKKSLKSKAAATGVGPDMSVVNSAKSSAKPANCAQSTYTLSTVVTDYGSKAVGWLSRTKTTASCTVAKKTKGSTKHHTANPELPLGDRPNLKITIPVVPSHAAIGPQLKFIVKKTIPTPFSEIRYMLPPGDNTVLVATPSVEERRRFRMTKLSLLDGEVLSTVALKVFWGMGLVQEASRAFIAVSDQDGCKIRLLDTWTLNQIDHMSLTPDWPSCICAAHSEGLLYVDESEQPFQVKSIKYNGGSQASAASGICSQRNEILDMCYIQRDGGRMVVLAHGTNRQVLGEELLGNQSGLAHGANNQSAQPNGGVVTAYDFRTGAKLWRVQGRLPGTESEVCIASLATDGRGHLFACDVTNKCVHMFSSEGKYVGAVLRSGEQGIGEPRLIRWCKSSSALVVAHKMPNENFKISKFQLAKINMKPMSR